MAIPEEHRENFEMMLQAFKHGDLSLIECKSIENGNPVYAVCANFRDKEGKYNIVPFAKMFDGNPYDELEPPATFDKEDYIARGTQYLRHCDSPTRAKLMEEFFVEKEPKFYKRCGIYLQREDIEPTFSQVTQFFAIQPDLPIEPFLDFVDDHLLKDV